jgi:PTH1 family peptidyl-tRNA hydrolase
MPPPVVIGLGNPGRRYAGTRHNLGFEVVDRLARGAGARFRHAGREYELAEASTMLLVRPTSYMNLSGTAVREACQATGADADRVLVVLDDIALPLGMIRLRRRGSDGGHNGLASIIEALGSTEIPRLRLGVGPALMPPAEMLAEFVLSRFEPEEQPVVGRMVARAAEASRVWADSGIEAAMNEFNTQDREPNDPDH